MYLYVNRLIVNTILISVLMGIEISLKYHHFKNKKFNSGNVNDCQTLLLALVFLKLYTLSFDMPVNLLNFLMMLILAMILCCSTVINNI